MRNMKKTDWSFVVKIGAVTALVFLLLFATVVLIKDVFVQADEANGVTESWMDNGHEYSVIQQNGKKYLYRDTQKVFEIRKIREQDDEIWYEAETNIRLKDGTVYIRRKE